MAKKVVLDADECVACGTCVEICPDVFKMDDGDDVAEVIKETGGPDDQIQWKSVLIRLFIKLWQERIVFKLLKDELCIEVLRNFCSQRSLSCANITLYCDEIILHFCSVS